MANFVIKKDGAKEPFDPEKIKKAISAAATQAGLPENEIAEVVEKVSSTVIQSFGGIEEVATTDIREKTLAELDASKPAVSDAWRKYEQNR